MLAIAFPLVQEVLDLWDVVLDQVVSTLCGGVFGWGFAQPIDLSVQRGFVVTL